MINHRGLGWGGMGAKWKKNETKKSIFKKNLKKKMEMKKNA